MISRAMSTSCGAQLTVLDEPPANIAVRLRFPLAQA